MSTGEGVLLILMCLTGVVVSIQPSQHWYLTWGPILVGGLTGFLVDAMRFRWVENGAILLVLVGVGMETAGIGGLIATAVVIGAFSLLLGAIARTILVSRGAPGEDESLEERVAWGWIAPAYAIEIFLLLMAVLIVASR